MVFIEGISWVLMLLLGAIATKSDLENGLIHNRTLAEFAIVAALLDLIYYGFFARDLVGAFLVNMAVVTVIDLVLFFLHSLAGGDTKLIIVLSLLFPAKCYYPYDGSIITLYWAIALAIMFGYLYLLVSSVVALMSRKNKVSKEYVKNYLISFIRSFLTAMVFISAINLLVTIGYMHGVPVNEFVIRILCVAVAWLVGRFEVMRKWYSISAVLIVDICLAVYTRTIPFSIRIENYILVIALLLLQMTIKTNLYELMDPAKIKKGVILSTMASVQMQTSRVRGLPEISSEDLRSRLTQDEVESVQRWSKINGVDKVCIVKKIPFAIFITIGYIGYFILWGVSL